MAPFGPQVAPSLDGRCWISGKKKKQCHDKINIRIRMQIKGTNVATGWLSRI